MAEESAVPGACKFLKDPLSIDELINSGTTFEINANFDEGFTNDIYDELNLGSDGEDEDKIAYPIGRVELASPWTRPFELLKEQMKQLNEYMWKRTTYAGDLDLPEVPDNSRVCIRYNAYWEGESAPFDSSFLRGSSYTFYINRNDVLEGLECAVRTMRRGEHAQFVISYHLLFREMGCPPRIKPKADGLFVIQLVTYNEIGDINAEQQIPEEDRNKYTAVIGKVKDIHRKGLDFFGQGMYRNACWAFKKALDILQFCQLSSEEEENKQKPYLLKLYTNLAVCYIKINCPAKTCIMCKEIRYLTNNKPSCKAIFQEGRALLMLGEYVRSRQLLLKAQNMEPNNEDIKNELKILEERYKQHKENENKMWTRALGIIRDSEVRPVKNAANVQDDMSIFTQMMERLLRDFKDDEGQHNLKLPSGLTIKEIHKVDALAKSLDLKLSLNPLGTDSSTIVKK